MTPLSTVVRTLTRAGLALVTAFALAGAVAPRAAAEVPVPDLKRFIVDTRLNGPFVGTINAVQATDAATIVYFSVGTRLEREMLPNSPGERMFLGFGHHSDSDIAAPADASVRLLRVIDPVGKKVYRPFATAKNPACVCTPISGFPTWDPATELLTLAAVLPPLPDGVTLVDIDVTGKGALVTDVPVTRGGALEPTVGSGGPVVMGSGWPVVDLADAATVSDPSPFITDLIAWTESTDEARRTQQTATRSEISVSNDVLFEVDQATLTPRAREQLALVAAEIDQHAVGQVLVVGHADSDGTEAHNLDLSRRRAQAVVAALAELLPGTEFVANGKGESEPVAPNDTPVNKSLNRRVTISYATEGGR